MPDADLGTPARRGDAWTLIFTRRLPHSSEKVWRVGTEPEHLAPGSHTKSWVGARPSFVTSSDAEDGFDGEMVVFDPPSGA